MKKFISVIMILMLSVSVFSFASCKKNDVQSGDETTTAESEKSTTVTPVEIAELPESTEDRVEMLNSALDYVDVYCYQYTKKLKCDVSGVNVGSLSSASNAVDAFKSIFGQNDVTDSFDYKAAPESFAENFIKERFKSTDVMSAEISQEGESIILKITFPNESNPSDSTGQLHKLSNDYQSVEKVNGSLKEFESSASSTNISASDIIVTATISSADSSLQKLVVSYTENFALAGVKLVQLDGSSVTGTSKTTVTYDDIK